MTTYGTIATESSASSNLEFISHAKEQIQSGIAKQRPWKEMIQLQAFNLPTSFSEFTQRIITNITFFRTNYIIIILFILFLCLLWHPISLIVFIVLMVAWLFLYFLRDEPLSVLGRVIDDRIVVMVLLIVTMVALFLTDVKYNIIIGVSIGVVIVLVHGTFRNTDAVLPGDEEEGFGSAAVMPSQDVVTCL